ncbi:MAG: Stk1 family PASTA domain-containing Ser/Thr kinase [Peptoniphilus lacrimalis]|uniref:non-specific serine/threonine protein kinase n=1 Tax=Peptoniphilus lacrimalis 315-B TaxID=596330 RepID=D1VSE0_9FIRM|nr:Stk1 family PASTA domain-containing Ser/Thr kinase [Peptoniphilus lacrimalis]EFA90623.1 kinase domain protein [Peptoniphilus lacrimalis 315-B]
MISKVLGKRYEILEKIGTGGMGNVYKAHDRRLDRIVAIKILKLEYNDDSNFIRKFKRESLAAASISHPNIVSIFDVGSETIDDDVVHYIVMEYIDGKTLKELINEDGRLPEKRALNYALQIAEALKMAHSKHIVHRDIKSQNIMVTKDDRVKVTDFGIARVADNTTVTATNAVMGSVHYFSPEQARGAKVDNRSDIYSMGIVLYEMLTGTLPFDADNPVSVALMQVQTNMPRPSDKVKSLSPGVDDLVLKMTRKDPNKRYKDVYDLIKDIKSILVNGRVIEPLSNYQKEDIDATVIENPIYQPSNEKRYVNRSSRDFPKDKEVIKKERKKKNSAAPAILGVFCAIIIIFLLAKVAPKAIAGLNNRDKVQEVELVDVVGALKGEAEAKLDSQGLKYKITTTEDSSKKSEEVISQDPAAGTIVKKGSTINLVINSLPDDVEIPQMKNYTLELAEDKLNNLGLAVGEVEYIFDEEIENEKIIYTEPQAGEKVARGAKVKIFISKGKDDEPVKIPSSYKGLSPEAPKAALEKLGLIVKIEEGYSGDVGKGEIYKIDPEQGTELAKGSTVTLYVSKGPQTEDIVDESEESDSNKGNREEQDSENNSSNSDVKTYSYKIKVPDDGKTHNIKAYRVKNSKGEEVNQDPIWNYNRDPGSTDNIKLIGKGVYEIYIDDQYVGQEVVK